MRSTFIGLYAQTLVRYSYGLVFFFFKQKTAYEMRISDWSSDVCSSDLGAIRRRQALRCRAKPCRHSRRALPAHLREGAFSGDADTRYRRGCRPKWRVPASARSPGSAGIRAPTNSAGENGRASSRERGGQNVWISGVDGSIKKNIKKQ